MWKIANGWHNLIAHLNYSFNFLNDFKVEDKSRSTQESVGATVLVDLNWIQLQLLAIVTQSILFTSTADILS